MAEKQYSVCTLHLGKWAQWGSGPTKFRIGLSWWSMFKRLRTRQTVVSESGENLNMPSTCIALDIFKQLAGSYKGEIRLKNCSMNQVRGYHSELERTWRNRPELFNESRRTGRCVTSGRLPNV